METSYCLARKKHQNILGKKRTLILESLIITATWKFQLTNQGQNNLAVLNHATYSGRQITKSPLLVPYANPKPGSGNQRAEFMLTCRLWSAGIGYKTLNTLWGKKQKKVSESKRQSKLTSKPNKTSVLKTGIQQLNDNSGIGNQKYLTG